jgi:hypoxanthine phosphoribosyltransferase
MTHSVSPERYLQQAQLIHNEDAVNSAINRIANQLNLKYVNELPVVLCVMGGAVYFTGQLLPKLTFPLELDYVQASRYQNNTEGSMVKWIMLPKDNVKNRIVLLLDDILDEGITLKAVAEQCYYQGAKDVKVVVLLEKILNKSKPIYADYVGLTVANRYVFGCGMDIYGWWRNLPAIYALNDN